MRIATWNVNSLKVRLPRLEEWLGYAKPDVLCLQETKLADAAFPALDIERLGYEWVHHGNGRWNGVAILSRVGLTDVVSGFDDGEDDEAAEARVITARCQDVLVTSVYVPNGRSLDHEMYAEKLRWLERLHEFVNRKATPSDRVAICGDFNVAPADVDVYDPTKFVGSTHVSEAERAAVDRLRQWGLVDGFRRQWKDDRVYSWWDYRAGDFHQHRGMRIDLLLLSAPLAEKITFALIDRNARKGQSPSDHAPVFVDIA